MVFAMIIHGKYVIAEHYTTTAYLIMVNLSTLNRQQRL